MTSLFAPPIRAPRGEVSTLERHRQMLAAEWRRSRRRTLAGFKKESIQMTIEKLAEQFRLRIMLMNAATKSFPGNADTCTSSMVSYASW
jgi:hypothetical protein